MNVYTPNNWVVLKVVSSGDVCYKILAGWLGSYSTGDSWKLSSGTTGIIDKGDYITFPQHSGSVYDCRKESEGLGSLIAALLCSWQRQLPQGAVMECIKYEDFVAEFNKSN